MWVISSVRSNDLTGHNSNRLYCDEKQKKSAKLTSTRCVEDVHREGTKLNCICTKLL